MPSCAFLIVLLLSVPALSHDPYLGWTVPGTAMSCCNNKDCRPTRARGDMDGNWEAWDGERWLKVPRERVLKMDSPDGRSHLCELNGGVLCFVPGPAMR